MAEYDGSIRVGVVIDDKKASKDLDKLRDRLTSETLEVDKQAAAVERLKKRYDDLISKKAEPAAIAKLRKGLQKAQEEAGKLDAKYQSVIQKAELDRAAHGVIDPETVDEYQLIKSQLDAANEKVEEFQRKISAATMPPENTEEAARLREEIAGATTELERLKGIAANTNQEVSQAEGNLTSVKEELQAIRDNAVVSNQEIVDMKNELADLEAKKQTLENAGLGIGYEEYDNTVSRIAEINRELQDYRKNLTSVEAAEDETLPVESDEEQKVNWWQKIGVLAKRAASTMVSTGGKAASAIGKLRDKIKGLGREKGFDKASKSAGRFATRLKSIVTGALFFNLISRGLTALTKKMGEYLTANKGFADALQGVKSNLLTAFQPVYDAVMPALTKLMEALESVTAKFAAFMATIFGTTAKQAQENAKALNEQADATEEVGKETKKASKFLASFDTIEKVAAEDTENASSKEETKPGEAGFGTDFSQIQPPEWLLNFWKVFQDSWAQYGQTTLDAFKTAWEAIKGLVTAVGKAFMSIWTGGSGVQTLNELQALLQMVLGIISSIAAAFKGAWESGGGEAVIGAIKGALDNVLKLILSIGQSFKAAWDTGIGQEILQTILDIITHIFETVGNLASRLREAWEANGNGQAIWETILQIVEDVLSFIDRIAKSTAEWAAGLDLEPIVSSFRRLLDAVEPLVDTLLDGMSWAWENILLPLAKWEIEERTPAVIDVLTEAFNILKAALDALKPVAEKIWEDFLSPLANWAGDVIAQGIELIAKAFGKISDWMQENQQLISDVSAVVLSFLAGLWVYNTTKKVLNFLTGPKGLSTSLVALAAAAVLVVGAWDDMTGLEKVVAVLALLTGAAIAAAIAVGALQSSWTLGIAAAAIVAGIVAITASLRSAENDANDAIKKSKSNAGQMSYGVPHLANGAVISPNSEFLAVLGDQKHGRNFEAPEGLLRQIVREELGNMQGAGQTNVNVTFSGSLAQLGRVLQPVITTETARLGPQLISGGGLA